MLLKILLPQKIEELHPLVVRGKYGLAGVVDLCEYLFVDSGKTGGTLVEKLERLMKAIDEVVTGSKQPNIIPAALRSQPQRTRWNIPDSLLIFHSIT